MTGKPNPHPAAFAAIAVAVMAVCFALVTACGGGSGDDSSTAVQPVTVTSVGPNAVSTWNEVAASTIVLPATAGGTLEEARPNYAVDLASVHVAIYDAVVAIAGTYRPYAITPAAAADGASQEAAVAAAAYGVLKGLFPSRSATYQPAYDSALAAIADGTAKSRGVALGAEVAARVLTLRANDGRSVVLAPFVSGTAPGQFRTASNPAARENPFIRPFVVAGLAQFRAPGPPALTSAAYTADVNEIKALGAATSTTRSASQTEIVRFHTEPPPLFWSRNLRLFATTGAPLVEQARLMAMLWVTHADAANTCFESKYAYLFWRPTTAITLDGDGNDATTADPTWVPVVPTPNHPEYPAAHSCVSGAMAEILRLYYGTADVTFDFTSKVTASTHHFTTTDALLDEVAVARIAGGMHFRTAITDGQALGKRVADWVASHAFQKR